MENQTKGRSKVYLEIVKQLRIMIEADQLKPGDKLPSERELSELLNAGRSSVREALRALELLGLIETRRGEGTFLRDFRSHQLVELLGTFILQDEKAKRDVAETKFFIEIDCLCLISQNLPVEDLERLKKWVATTEFTDDEFFLKIVELSENHLFLRIWLILKDYYNALGLKKIDHSKNEYLAVINELIKRDQMKVINIYRKLRQLMAV